MSDSSALDSFLDKWRARWPEWDGAEIFVPAARRRTTLAWFALLQEFEDAMNVAGDPLPADAKLSWWVQELGDWAGRRSRHPLGRLLEPQRAPWDRLADALPALIAAREPAADPAQAFARLRGYGQAVVAIENALMDGQGGEAAVQAEIAQTLAARADSQAGAALWNEAGASVPAALLRQWPARFAGGRERRLWSALARLRLQRQAGHGGPAPLASPLRRLFVAWRAARD